MTVRGEFRCGDCLDLLRDMPADSVDLVLGSPPYEAARTYGIGFKLRGQDWVDWCIERYLQCVRVSRGAVAWVVEGQTKQFRWSAVPALLMADLHRHGVKLRKPPIFQRVGIPGSGGPDWFRNDYEFIVCSSKGKLPWSDNTAAGHAPKWAPGGAMSHRNSAGTRRNRWGGGHAVNGRGVHGTGEDKGHRPSHRLFTARQKLEVGAKTRISRDSSNMTEQVYFPPVLANPGNVLQLKVGGGVMGNRLCHENEAPFPEDLAAFFIRSCCPPGGTVIDPFSGSGTTVCVAVRHGRNGIGLDLRPSQIELGYRRLAAETGAN